MKAFAKSLATAAGPLQAGTYLRFAAQQLGFFAPSLVAQRALARLTGRYERPNRAVQRALLERLGGLYREDLRNAKNGIYPTSLLTQIPIKEYGRALPRFVWDMPKVLKRRDSNQYRDLPLTGRSDHFPAYYKRNFHWQSDGYLSDKSAALYDIGVEFLFLGSADMMRRQIIPPMQRWLKRAGNRRDDIRILDVACGTGRTLSQVGATFPNARFHAIDLSPNYVRKAQEVCKHIKTLDLKVENAEHISVPDASFDIAYCVYLFHELPKPARRAVAAEMFRVLAPGGLVVLEDSAQKDATDIERVLSRFPEDFHEPFFEDYRKDDLASLLTEVGFEVLEVSDAFVSKVVAAIKPQPV